MSRYPQTYRSSRVFRRILSALMAIVIAAAVLFVVLFFGLKKYIVYTSDGIRLEIPFLSDFEETAAP